jgi:hypothetical protein
MSHLDLARAFRAAAPRPPETGAQGEKKNYAERLSRQLAQAIADALRAQFTGILPTSKGGQQESRARTAKGYKKLDVNYSTVELGLGLGVSIKTLNFRDGKSARYTKNYTRIDNELRSEATDYHVRQPFSVLVGVLFLPVDSADDGTENTPSSFGSAVQIFRQRAGRSLPADYADRFERFFVALYDLADLLQGDEDFVDFFDVMNSPPKTRRPRTDECLRADAFIEQIRLTYDARNNPPFEWAP